MLAKTDYRQYLEQTFETPVRNIFGNYFIDQKGQVYYNTRPLTKNWRRSRSGAIYHTFRLWRNETKKIETYYIHRLMALIWLGDVEGKTVNHNDGDTTNNDLLNLSIMTMLENCHDKIERQKEKTIIYKEQFDKIECNKELQVFLRKDCIIYRFKEKI